MSDLLRWQFWLTEAIGAPSAFAFFWWLGWLPPPFKRDRNSQARPDDG